MSKYSEILKKYWGYPSFRPLQEDIIKSVADENKDTLGLLPTGGGKSIIFQVPALASEGIALVITPLIALMKDQVENLKARGIKAIAIYSGMSKHEIEVALDNATYGNYKFLYLSPERLGTEKFQERLKDMNISLVAIDEAHCISQWGYDFRPSYLKIAEIRKHLPDNVPFLALTATATPEVVEDIQEKLHFKEKNVFRKSFYRPNLIYIVRKTEDKYGHLLKVAKNIKGSGVVYVRSRRKTKEVADFLISNGISADHYHAGIKPEKKEEKQDLWKQNRIRIIVATNAFGMGIDKPDVRFVVHLDIPDSIEAYFQEAGRGGRDGKTAYAIMIYNDSDISNLKRSIKNNYPPLETIQNVYEAIGNFYQLPVGSGKGNVYEFDLSKFISTYKFNALQAYNSLKILQNNGYIELTEAFFNPSRIKFIVDREDLYKFQVKNAHFDNFIKVLLRTYTGLFTEYAKINEDYLARIFNTDKKVIFQYLNKLSSLQLINYLPQTNSPLIIFTEERLDLKNLRIVKEKYHDLKERYEKRVNAMINYVTHTQKCRSVLLLEYFGEKNAQPCGECDVCREKQQGKIDTAQFKKIILDIAKKLEEKPLLPENIAQEMQIDENLAMRSVRWLLDNNYIFFGKDFKLHLK